MCLGANQTLADKWRRHPIRHIDTYDSFSYNGVHVINVGWKQKRISVLYHSTDSGLCHYCFFGLSRLSWFGFYAMCSLTRNIHNGNVSVLIMIIVLSKIVWQFALSIFLWCNLGIIMITFIFSGTQLKFLWECTTYQSDLFVSAWTRNFRGGYYFNIANTPSSQKRFYTACKFTVQIMWFGTVRDTKNQPKHIKC